jgi:hypothetical protein
MDLSTWAVPQLSKLLPLDEDSLKQIVVYADTLPKDKAAEHLKNLLGDSPQALEFISSFNQRRRTEHSAGVPSEHHHDDLSEVPKPKPRKKKAAGLNKLPPPRRPDDSGDTSGGYMKTDLEDYMSAKPKSKNLSVADALALKVKPEPLQTGQSESSAVAHKTSPLPSRSSTPKLPPSAAGPLISDSRSSSRKGSPAPKTRAKVSITGGTAMHGQSTVVNDLDSAIRALEVQTNPTLQPSAEENARRKCNCMATRHPLLEAAPNCMNCGKIICVKQGLGPCTFCGNPLLSSNEIQSMIRILREERGKEKMEVNNASHKRAEISKAARPFQSLSTPVSSSAPSSDSETEKLSAAKAHRDKLLNFQAQNARRTRIHDEAADFETPDAGTNMWASPQERALQLKRQQKMLREQEWNARPEYEKRRVVASIDLVGGKVMRRMAAAERPRTPDSEDDPDMEVQASEPTAVGSGAFSRNPLLGKLIKPVATIDGKGKGIERKREPMWRRVQDDEEDNEQWILDGGAYGRGEAVEPGTEEPACG